MSKNDVMCMSSSMFSQRSASPCIFIVYARRCCVVACLRVGNASSGREYTLSFDASMYMRSFSNQMFIIVGMWCVLFIMTQR